MTQLKDNMSNIEKIKAEIERRRHYYGKRMLQPDGMVARAKFDELTGFLAFIDSLPEETCKDSLQVQETYKENQDSFTSPEEAAEEYARLDEEGKWKDGGKYKGFIAGAKWMSKRMNNE